MKRLLLVFGIRSLGLLLLVMLFLAYQWEPVYSLGARLRGHEPHAIAKVMLQRDARNLAWAEEEGSTLWVDNPEALEVGQGGVVPDGDSAVLHDAPYGNKVIVLQLATCTQR